MSDMVVVARNGTEMRAAQSQMLEWANLKLVETRTHLAEVEENLAHAKERKWKLSGWQSSVRVAKARVEFYEKIYAALEQGYVIVPDFPLDVFAVRTKREYPVKHYNTSQSEWGDRTDRTQRGDAIALGEGYYVDSEPNIVRRTKKLSDGNVEYQRWAKSFIDVDFPIKAVKPVILEETSRALTLKIFDEIGIIPARPGKQLATASRGADPMVIGRIIYRKNRTYQHQWKTVSFLIAWWLRAEDVEL